MLFEKIEDFKFKNTILGIISTILYGIVYFIMVVLVGEANGGWPDFYGFTFGGNIPLCIITVICMIAGSYGICVLIWLFQNKNNKK